MELLLVFLDAQKKCIFRFTLNIHSPPFIAGNTLDLGIDVTTWSNLDVYSWPRSENVCDICDLTGLYFRNVVPMTG